MKKMIKFATLFITSLAIFVGGVLINTMPVEAYWESGDTLYIDNRNKDDWNQKDHIQQFIHYNSLTSLIVIDTSDDHDNNKIPSRFFLNNKELKSVDIQVVNCIIEEEAFASCMGIETLSLAEGITIGSGAFGNCTSLRSVEIKGGVIMSSAFYRCTSLATVTIEDTTKMEQNTNNKMYDQFLDSGLTKINIISTDANNTKELLGKLSKVKLDLKDLSTINIEFPEGMSAEDRKAISTKFVECFGDEMNTNIDIKIPPTPGSDSSKEGKASESASTSKSATSTPATPAEVTFMLDSMSRIAKAKQGDTVIIDGRELGIHSYSLAFMKTIAENRKANIILKYRYQGVEFEVTIPAGAKITLNEDIPWYGPLYIYSGALGKDVKINITAKK